MVKRFVLTFRICYGKGAAFIRKDNITFRFLVMQPIGQKEDAGLVIYSVRLWRTVKI